MSELNDYMWEQIELNSYGKDKLVHIVNEQAKEISIMRDALDKITMAVLSVHQGSDEFILKTAQQTLQKVGGER